MGSRGNGLIIYYGNYKKSSSKCARRACTAEAEALLARHVIAERMLYPLGAAATDPLEKNYFTRLEYELALLVHLDHLIATDCNAKSFRPCI